MDWVDIAIVVFGIAAIAWLLHAANVIGQNPYQRLEAHEDMVGKMSPDLSMEEKQSLLDRRGIAPRTAGRVAFRIVAIGIAAAVLVWLRR
jgi:hypothetical protein